MDTNDYLRILRKNWILILLVGVIGLGIGFGAAVSTKPTYVSETQLFVAIQSSGSVAELQQGNTFSQARIQSYVKAATTPVVLQPTIDQLGLDSSPASLASQIKVSSDPNTVLINILAQDPSAVKAAALAKEVGVNLIKAVDSLEQPITGGSSPVHLSVVTPAVAPSHPSSPNIIFYVAAGLVLGLLVGVVAAFLRTAFDTRIRGEDQFKEISTLPILGGIANDSSVSRSPVAELQGQHSAPAEAFKSIRTNLHFASVSMRSKSIMVTSSLPDEGKSTIAANLAFALVQAGERVCLIDADLRRPSIAKYLGLEANAGLTTALVGAADVSELLQSTGKGGPSVLASGQIPPNPSELLGSPEMRQLIIRLERDFDTIIFDAPPLLPVTDAAVLSQHVGGVVLVVRAQRTKKSDVARATSALEFVGANMLGVVLNRLRTTSRETYGYGRYGYGPIATEGNAESLSAGHSRRQGRVDPTGERVVQRGDQFETGVASLDTIVDGSETPRAAKSFRSATSPARWRSE